MKKLLPGIIALIIATATVSFTKINEKKSKKYVTYFFVYDATGRDFIYPCFPFFPPTNMPVSCFGSPEINCVSEFTGFTINSFTIPARCEPVGTPIQTWLKPVN